MKLLLRRKFNPSQKSPGFSQRSFSSNSAFTLVELLLATAILTFALSGLLALFCNIVTLNETNQNQFFALNHAEFVMEEIKNTAFPNISPYIQNGNWDWDVGIITSKGLLPLTNELINTSVSGSSALDITVVVSWFDRGNRARSFTLATQMVSP